MKFPIKHAHRSVLVHNTNSLVQLSLLHVVSLQPIYKKKNVSYDAFGIVSLDESGSRGEKKNEIALCGQI